MAVDQRLPTVNGDDGQWGDILRKYLTKEHYNDDTNNAANGGHQNVTIRAGTSSAAPLTFASGTNLTTATAGSMEYDGSYYYLTPSSAVRKKIAIYDDASGATGDLHYRDSSGNFTRLGIGSTGNVLSVSGGIPAWTSGVTGSTIGNTNTVTLKDTNFTLQDDGDTTKQLQFQLSGITTGTTRTITVPNFTGTMYVTGGTDVAVADGGTGRSTSTTAYGIIAAGTTATGAHQTIAPGTSGQFLKSAGTSALAAFASITAADISGAISGMLLPVQGHTRGEETYTISSGSVTQITGTTLMGVWSPAVGDRILILTAPSSTGAGTQYYMTSNPGNGIYTVTANTTNLVLSRTSDMSGSINPAGLSVFSENASLPWMNQSIFTVVSPTSAAAFTYGSGGITFASTGGTNIQPNSVYIANGQLGLWNDTPAISTKLLVNSSAPSGTEQNLTLPAPTTDTIVSRTSTDTLTNKTINASLNTLTNIGTSGISDSAITSAKIADGTIVNADVSASAAIALSKLATGYVSANVNGTATTTIMWRGTQAQYDAITTKDSNTLYFVSG